MSLRRQLLLVSLLLLSLPWAGCQYLREMENTLQQGQQMAVVATADAIAAALAARAELVYPMGQKRLLPPSNTSWAIPRAELPLISDGYANDWREQSNLIAVDGTPADLRLWAASKADRLFLLIDVDDSTVTYATPGEDGDRIELSCIDAIGSAARYLLSAEGPGRIDLRTGAGSVDSFSLAARGAWRESENGYRVELQLPLDSRCQRLALNVFDANPIGEVLRFDSRTLHDGNTPWLVYQSTALREWLEPFAAGGRHIEVRDRLGLKLAADHRSAQDAANSDDDVFWVLQWLYRVVLRDSATGDETQISPVVAAKLRTDFKQRLLQASVEMRGDAGLMGRVTVTESTERFLALTDQATSRLFAISAMVVLVAFAALLTYASVLSWRIRRLSRAARGIASGELATEDWPQSAAADELGELSRSYADLLNQIDEYNRYLRGLARSLAHELRTPIAVVGSSLENLTQKALAPELQQTYVDRAKDGNARLERLVASMTEASGIEDSLEDSSRSQLELTQFLASLVCAYRDAYPNHRFTAEVPEAGISIEANGDLLAQALDKLVSNAVSFTVAGSVVVLALRLEGGFAAISVSNPGPLLPEELRERLFEPMVSVRPRDRIEGTHLGLGLHIAKSVAVSHHGNLQAANLKDGSGVVFTLLLPRA